MIALTEMAKRGRPTDDPKPALVAFRAAPRDVEALERVAKRHGISIGDAARRVVREALGVPAELPKRKSKKGGAR